MCIYLGELNDLTYNSKEHVIPAGLGCHTKLPIGTVSDQANEYFSPIERRVLEKTFIQMARIIEGPGKRGSLSPKNATTSDVSIIDFNGNLGLGFMKGNKGYILPQFIISDLLNNPSIRYWQEKEQGEGSYNINVIIA